MFAPNPFCSLHLTEKTHDSGLLRSMYCKCAHKGEEPQLTLNQLPLGAPLEQWPSRTVQLPELMSFSSQLLFRDRFLLEVRKNTGLYFGPILSRSQAFLWQSILLFLNVKISPAIHFCVTTLLQFRVDGNSPDFIMRKKKQSALQKNKSPAWVQE